MDTEKHHKKALELLKAKIKGLDDRVTGLDLTLVDIPCLFVKKGKREYQLAPQLNPFIKRWCVMNDIKVYCNELRFSFPPSMFCY